MKNFIFIALLLLVSTKNWSQSVWSDTSFTALRYSHAQLVVPSVLTVGGFAINSNKPHSVKNQIKDYRNQHFPTFRTKADDVLMFMPSAIAVGLGFSNIPSRTNVYDRTALFVKSQVINFGATHILKYSFGQLRPDNSAYNAMPSGHTSMSFASATFLSMEYQDALPWVPYVAYGIASTVGVLRVANNRHYLSDVLVGAALGILSTKITYWTHQYRWNRLAPTSSEANSLFRE